MGNIKELRFSDFYPLFILTYNCFVISNNFSFNSTFLSLEVSRSKFSPKLGIDKLPMILAPKKGMEVIAAARTDFAPPGPGEVASKMTFCK